MELKWQDQRMYKDGRTPLHTFRADIDYAFRRSFDSIWLNRL